MTFLNLCIKDRVGRSRQDSPWAHLNANISFNIQDRKTFDTSKNSPLSYLFTDVGHHFVLQGSLKGENVKDKIKEFPY